MKQEKEKKFISEREKQEESWYLANKIKVMWGPESDPISQISVALQWKQKQRLFSFHFFITFSLHSFL